MNRIHPGLSLCDRLGSRPVPAANLAAAGTWEHRDKWAGWSMLIASRQGMAAMAGVSQKDGSVVFWPWGRRSGIVLAGLLLVILVGGLIVLHFAADWPDARWEPAFLLAAVLLSLVPIGLLVLEAVAESQGSVSFRGVSVNFGAVAKAAAAVPATISVPRNVADEGVDVGDSGHSEVLSVLRNASRAEVVVVDLEDGHAWWDSRLLLLCAGAELQGSPAAVVFVATVDGVHRRFIGWARPGDVVQSILKADSELRFAHAVACTSMRRAELTFPSRSAPGTYPAITPALDTQPKPTPVVTDHELFDRHAETMLPQPPAVAMTRALGRTMHPIEEGERVGHVSVVRLLALLAPALRMARIEESASDDEWTGAVLNLEADFLAVTMGGVYQGLAPRSHLVRELLKTILMSLNASPGAVSPLPPDTAIAAHTGAPSEGQIDASLPLVPEARMTDARSTS